MGAIMNPANPCAKTSYVTSTPPQCCEWVPYPLVGRLQGFEEGRFESASKLWAALGPYAITPNMLPHIFPNSEKESHAAGSEHSPFHENQQLC